MRHWIIGILLGLTIVSIDAQTGDVSPFVITNGHIQEPTPRPAPRVTVNPQATFITIHDTVDEMAVLCIEHRYGLIAQARPDRLPERTCKVILDWVR